jgi:hypothetical protein
MSRPRPRFGWSGQATVALPQPYTDAGVEPGDHVQIAEAFVCEVLVPDLDDKWCKTAIKMRVLRHLTTGWERLCPIGCEDWWRPWQISKQVPKIVATFKP